MTSFPTPHTVGHAVFTGTGEDPDTGDDVELWADPVPVKVIAYQPSSAENVNGYSSRVTSDIDMAIPAGLTVSMRDRFILPGITGTCEVTGIEDANHGPFGWMPGAIVKLKQVTG